MAACSRGARGHRPSGTPHVRPGVVTCCFGPVQSGHASAFGCSGVEFTNASSGAGATTEADHLFRHAAIRSDRRGDGPLFREGLESTFRRGHLSPSGQRTLAASRDRIARRSRALQRQDRYRQSRGPLPCGRERPHRPPTDVTRPCRPRRSRPSGGGSERSANRSVNNSSRTVQARARGSPPAAGNVERIELDDPRVRGSGLSRPTRRFPHKRYSRHGQIQGCRRIVARGASRDLACRRDPLHES